MNTCGYCGIEVHVKKNGLAYCTFCEMDLFKEDIQENGQRKWLKINTNVLLSDAKQSTSALMEKDSYFLISLLRLVRAERKQVYNLMRLVNRGNRLQGGFEASLSDVKADYQFWKRKAYVLENILREQSCVFPVRITDQLLSTMLDQIEQDKHKTMDSD